MSRRSRTTPSPTGIAAMTSLPHTCSACRCSSSAANRGDSMRPFKRSRTLRRNTPHRSVGAARSRAPTRGSAAQRMLATSSRRSRVATSMPYRATASGWRGMATLAEAVAALGDTVRARVLHELLIPYADRCVITFALLCQGSASRSLGLLATTLSRFEQAAQHFEQALEFNARIRAPIWLAHTQHDYARMLLLRNHVGDRDRALELLRTALTTAERLGMKALADKTRPLELAAHSAASSSGLARTG
jgi:tetratricopeptide (TPR) repeat protein